MVKFKEVTKENLDTLLRLNVHDHQKDQVAHNGDSILRGNYSDVAWFRGIYKEDEAVGFVMLALYEKEKEYHVWRFMIDKNHQGKGYGRAAMEMIKEVVKEKFPDAKEIHLSYVPKEKGGADAFYTKVGFQDTGEMNEDEKIMCFKY